MPDRNGVLSTEMISDFLETYTMPNRIPAAEVCDARDDDSSNAADIIKNSN